MNRDFLVILGLDIKINGIRTLFPGIRWNTNNNGHFMVFRAANLGLHGDVMRSGSNLRLLLSAESDVGFPKEITLKLAHPTRAGQDQLVQMVLEGQGFYSGKLATEVSGRWLVSIEDPVAKWRLQGDWQADSVEPLRLKARSGT